MAAGSASKSEPVGTGLQTGAERPAPPVLPPAARRLRGQPRTTTLFQEDHHMAVNPTQRSDIAALYANPQNRVRARGIGPDAANLIRSQRPEAAARSARAEAQQKTNAAQAATPAQPAEPAQKPERIPRSSVLPEDRLLNNLRVYKLPETEEPGGANEQTPLAGDVNNDGKVDVFDFNELASAYGTANDDIDIFKDGVIDDADMAILRQNFGKSV